MKRTEARTWAVIAALVGCAPAMAQLIQPQTTGKKVEQGIGDLGPNSLTLRNMQLDQRLPSGFDSVYEVQWYNQFGTPGERSTPMFMRVDGNVWAVFPRSVYAREGGGLLPQIPPDTVFYIGGLPKSFGGGEKKAPGSVAENFLDLRVRSAVSEGEEGQAGAGEQKAGAQAPSQQGPRAEQAQRLERPQISMFEDEEFRRYRVAKLLESGLVGR